MSTRAAWLPRLLRVSGAIDEAVEEGFATRALRPMEFGGDQGLQAATSAIADILSERLKGKRLVSGTKI